jgi:hypothetical protein
MDSKQESQQSLEEGNNLPKSADAHLPLTAEHPRGTPEANSKQPPASGSENAKRTGITQKILTTTLEI